MSKQIKGADLMAAALTAEGLAYLTEVTNGATAIVVPFADGYAQRVRDAGEDDWEYLMFGPDFEVVFGGSSEITGRMMLESVLAYAEEHGRTDAAGVVRWQAARSAARDRVPPAGPTPERPSLWIEGYRAGLADGAKQITVTLTPAQHRLLRDVVAWAAADIQEGPEDTFWSHIVLPEDWDAAVATMQEIDGILNPPESLAG